jgi:hypothetical protein
VEEFGRLVRRDFKRRFADVELERVHVWYDARGELVKEPDAALFGYVKRPFLERLRIAAEVDAEEPSCGPRTDCPAAGPATARSS